MIKDIYRDHDLRGAYAHAENRRFIEEPRAAGMKVEAASLVAYETKCVEKTSQYLKDRRLVISTACPSLIREMFRLHYRKDEEIAEEDDHGPGTSVYW